MSYECGATGGAHDRVRAGGVAAPENWRGNVSPGDYRLAMTPTRELLSVRTGAAPRTALAEEISPALEPTLRGWIRETASLDPEEARLLLIRFDLVLPDAYRTRYQEQLQACEARQAELDTEWEAARAAHAAKYESEDRSVPFMLPRSVAPAPLHPCVA